MIQNDVVHSISDKIVRRYNPLGCLDLPAKFASVKDTGSLLDFVHKWGDLGYWNIASREQRKYSKGGMPVNWALSHSKGVQIVLKLLNLLDLNKDSYSQYKILDYLQNLKGIPSLRGAKDERWPYINNIGKLNQIVQVDYSLNLLNHLEENTELISAEFVAREMVANIINENTSIASRQLLIIPQNTKPIREGESTGNFIYNFSFKALIVAIYIHLTESALGNIYYRFCENPRCGMVFKTTNPRQRYCPHPKGFKGRSACMNAAGMQRARKKPKEARHERVNP